MADTTENPNEETIKCVIVGDNNVGKTRLICARAYNASSHNNRCILGNSHVPTVWAIDQYRNNEEVLQNSRCVVDGILVSLRLWDTFGDHHKDRRFAYGKADVVVICFSVCDEKSLQQVQRFWVPEVRKHCKNIPVILVACKVDLRFADLGKLNLAKRSKTIRRSDILYPDQCRPIVELLSCPYYETSVLLGFGIQEVFENVCRAALLYRRSLYFWNTGLKRVLRPALQEPLAPPLPEPPQVDMNFPEPSALPNLMALYESAVFADVAFVCQERKLPAHKVILGAASTKLCQLLNFDVGFHEGTGGGGFQVTSPTSPLIEVVADEHAENESDAVLKEPFSKRDATTNSFAKRERPCGALPEPAVEYQGKDSSGRDVFAVALPFPIMEIVVRFCYSGCLALNSHDLSQSHVIDLLTQVIVASKHFGLADLVKLAAHCINTDPASCASELTQHFLAQRADRLRKLFLDQERYADIIFKVDDGFIFGHKIVLCSGCDVLNAMLSGPFMESENKEVTLQFATTKSLKAMFEHVYTQNVTNLAECLDDDLADVIMLADRFCLPQLVSQVEIFTVKLIKEKEKEYLKTSDRKIVTGLCEDVLRMLEVAQLYNALRLCNWCLHFLCVHYNEACRNVSKLIKNLPAETQQYLSQNRWPPVWYIKQRDAYEKRLAERNAEDAVRVGRKVKK